MATATSFPDRLTTVVGQPKTIALKYKTGKVTKTGNVMYSLTSGLVAFFPPAVAAEIDSLNLDPGEPFTICHRGGPRWDVERAQGNGAGTGQRVAAPSSETAVGTPHNRTPPPPPPQLPVNGAGDSSAEILKRSYCDAVDIALYTVECAQQKGLRITPLFEDVRAIAFSISGLGGRR